MIKLRKSDFSSIKNVDDLYFEVEERKIYYDDIYNNPYLDNNFKGIVKTSSDKLLSIVNKNYTLATNKSIVEPLINELENFDTKWYIDPSHSFYNDKRMKEINAHLLMNIHDELLIEAPKEYANEARELLVSNMVLAGKELKAQLRCDSLITDRWFGKELSEEDLYAEDLEDD